MQTVHKTVALVGLNTAWKKYLIQSFIMIFNRILSFQLHIRSTLAYIG